MEENQLSGNEKLTGDALIAANLSVLLEAVKTQPENLFALSRYSQVKECGTLFCTAGLAATMPYFKEQGMELKQPYKNDVTLVYINGIEVDDLDVADSLFGEDAWTRLFATYGHGDFDADTDSAYCDWRLFGRWNNQTEPEHLVTDKTLAIARLERQLAIYQAKVKA